MLCNFSQCLKSTLKFVQFTSKTYHSFLSYPLGPIPSDFALLQNLQILGLDNNQLTSMIPKFLGGFSSLTQLWLGSNQLTGKKNTFILHILKLLVNILHI